ncbi:hypothetical protein ACLBOM_31095 [Escherichia coli]
MKSINLGVYAVVISSPGWLLTEKAPLTRHLVPVVAPESIVIPPAPVANDTLVAEVSDAAGERPDI